MTKLQVEFLKQNKNLIFDRFKYKYPDCSEEQFEDYYRQYCNLRPFKASGNIFESGQNISAEVHYLMRLIVQFFFEQAFDAMLIDLNDPALSGPMIIAPRNMAISEPQEDLQRYSVVLP